MSENVDINSFMDSSFRWFTGVVEDIYDPEEMGRVKVRCYGYHTADLNQLPTKDLPFAHVMMPVTSAAMGGIGQSATGLLQGSWVIGFFRDGHACQDPFIMGSLPSFSSEVDNAVDQGFRDPSGKYPKESRVDNPKSSTSEYYESESYKTKVDLYEQSKVEVAGSDSPLNIPKAIPPNNKILVDNKQTSYFDRASWIPPNPVDTTKPSYPKNNVIEYESGHTVEFDNTAGRERILTMHKNGTYEEMTSSERGADKTVIVKGNNYKVIINDDHVCVKGNCNLTVDGDVRTLTKGDYYLEVEGNYHLNVKGNKYEKIGLSHFNETLHDFSHNINGEVTTRIGKSERRLIVGAGVDSPAITYNFENPNNVDIQIGKSISTVINGAERKTVLGNIEESCNTYLFNAKNIDIDALTDMTMDAPQFSLDYTNGNITTTSGTITSQTRTLHSHTHSQGADSAGNSQAETSAPTADT